MGEAAKEIRRLGRYSLLTKIASGGMGEVHLARLDSVQGVEKLFAIKLLLPQFAEEQSVVDMFVTEARIAARIAHTNVCQVFELGLEGEELFICMEYLRGIPATTILKTHKPLNPVSHRISIAIVKQAAAGLQFAHDLRDENGESLDVVHRDISPGNIFITAGGTAKVLDFGVVKAKDSSHKTKTGALKGKFGYMSPEQIMAEPLDSRSDIFSLGIVLFELLTNRRLFTRDSEYGTLKAITESPIPTLASFRPDLPEELGAVLAKALSRDREERYQSMRAFGEALSNAMIPYGGIADAAEIGDFIQSRYAQNLSEIDAMLKEVGRQTTPPPPTSKPKISEERTEVLRSGIATPVAAAGADEATKAFSEVPSETTESADPLPFSHAAPQAQKSPAMAIAVAVVGLAAVALLAVVLLKKDAPPPAAGIVYEGQLTPDKGNTPAPVGVPEARTIPDAASAIATEPDAGSKPRATSPGKKPVKEHPCERKKTAKQRNGCYVAASGRKLKSCLREHAASVSGSPKMKLVFDLSASGKVQDVSISPAQVAATPLGACVKGVAAKIRFGEQDSDVVYSVPLTINQK